MRITSGYLLNRKFEVPLNDVRPTMEAVREALFSSLGGHCNELSVLDLYSGTGSLGLEAWSRGAKSVTFVERNHLATETIRRNIDNLKTKELGVTRIICDDAIKYILETKDTFNLILADPPYDMTDAFEKTLSALSETAIFTKDGLLVYEMRKRQEWNLPSNWLLKRNKCYGKTRILILSQES